MAEERIVPSVVVTGRPGEVAPPGTTKVEGSQSGNRTSQIVTKALEEAARKQGGAS
jgi:hypothetical protein